MKNTKTLDNLKDSALLYEKMLPPFGYVILLVLLALLAGVVIWSVNTPRVYVIKSPGNVQSVNKNYVMSPYSGEIVSIAISEGANVRKGDRLFTVKSAELDLQDTQLAAQRVIYETQIAQFGKLVRSIQQDKNLFGATDPDDTLYYSQFELYKSQVAQQSVDTGSLKAYGYTSAQIEAEVSKAESKTAEIYYAAIKAAEDQILQAQMQLDAIDAQLEAVKEGHEDYTVAANETGRIHMLTEYKEGMVVQAGSPLASIASENDRYEIIATVPASEAPLIGPGDKTTIAVSGLTQTVYGTVSGTVAEIDTDITVPQSEGTATQPYFRAKIALDNGYLISKSGHKVNLTNGMVVETRIEYDRVSYFHYVLESIGLRTR
ncbi:MAG: HlyD family secretion protein [Clostridiales Family XIII bacterium]|jgi:multidrug resistance efflux pump|nr:HlyD family secretion protein [Clostridiales Family XIII bacterium]